MVSRSLIPRFLLPARGPLWRGLHIPPSMQVIRVRYASAGRPPAAPKPVVLEKPAKFNPPSHGSRLRRGATPKHYGPQLTAAEVAAQNKRHYPGLMAPEGSWSHWFWHSRLLHTVITMGTLFLLGVYTFFMNYTYNSPFKDLVPPFSDLWHQPYLFFEAWKNVIVLHEQEKSVKAREHRFSHLDDVAKRRYFMKMHGIEPKNPVHMIFGDAEQESEEELEAAALGLDPPPKVEAEGEKKAAEKKKWFGIW
ncbi:hypothetical protein CDD83_6223 [Cordyceps sp. RAO-2017]|nr:hypothetical protein CDD83_6223 [Cordyceps sp. RAO-2017]